MFPSIASARLRRASDLKGMAIGFGDSYYYSFVKEPLTLDFSNQP
jgi:hypothetical protein